MAESNKFFCDWGRSPLQEGWYLQHGWTPIYVFQEDGIWKEQLADQDPQTLDRQNAHKFSPIKDIGIYLETLGKRAAFIRSIIGTEELPIDVRWNNVRRYFESAPSQPKSTGRESVQADYENPVRRG